MKSHSITAYQAYALVTMTVIGINVLILPRKVVIEAGTDGVWILILSILFTLGIAYMITRLCQRFAFQSFVQFTEQILSSKRYKWLGKVLKIPFILSFALVWFIMLAYVTRTFGEVIVSTIFEYTPLEFVMFTFICVAALIASAPPEVVVKFNELLLPLVFIPLIFLLISFFQQGEIIRFLPLFQIDWQHVLQSSIGLTYDFTGYSIILIFMAYYQQPEKAVKSHLLAILTIGIFNWLVLSTTIGVFGVDEVRHLAWPTLEMVRVIELPVQIFQRLESGMIALWMVASFTTVTNIFAGFIELVRQQSRFSVKKKKWIALISIPIIIVVSMIPKNIEDLFGFLKIAEKYVLLVYIGIPLILLVIALIRRKGGKSNAAS